MVIRLRALPIIVLCAVLLSGLGVNGASAASITLKTQGQVY